MWLPRCLFLLGKVVRHASLWWILRSKDWLEDSGVKARFQRSLSICRCPRMVFVKTMKTWLGRTISELWEVPDTYDVRSFVMTGNVLDIHMRRRYIAPSSSMRRSMEYPVSLQKLKPLQRGILYLKRWSIIEYMRVKLFTCLVRKR